MTTIARAYDAKLDVEPGSRTIVSTINTASVDRYNTVILPGGAKLENYRKNPVVLAMHDGLSVPVGKNLWIKPDGQRLIAKTKWLPEGVDELADKLWRLYQEGYLGAWSISMSPVEWGKPTTEEIRKHPEWAGADVVYRQWELLEYSAVTVPGNAECLTEAVSRGLALPGWDIAGATRGGAIDPSGQDGARGGTGPAEAGSSPPPLPPLAGRTRDQVKAAALRMALGRVPSAAAAHAREAAELARGMV